MTTPGMIQAKTGEWQPDPSLPLAPDPPGSELTQQGRDVRGVYIPLARLLNPNVDELVTWIVDRINAEAVIFDVKDDTGRVSFTQELPSARSRIHGLIDNMDVIVEALHKRNVYVIGRLVCFKDHQLPRVKPETGVLDRRTGKLWRDKTNNIWTDPYSAVVHQHIAEVAVAAQAIGFDEIQLDYVRFPVDPESKHAIYRNRRAGMRRYGAIASLLYEVDSVLDLPLSIDVFGVTAFRKGDPNGLGQSLEHLAPYIDVISPMLYLANWHQKIWENPRKPVIQSKIHDAIRRIKKRLPDEIIVRPLLQAFQFRAEELYGPVFIQYQIEAAERGGASGHLFWNPRGRYGAVAVTWDRMD